MFGQFINKIKFVITKLVCAVIELIVNRLIFEYRSHISLFENC